MGPKSSKTTSKTTPPLQKHPHVKYWFHLDTSQSYENIQKITFKSDYKLDTHTPALLDNLLQYSKSLKLMELQNPQFILQHTKKLSQFNCSFQANLYIQGQCWEKQLSQIGKLNRIKQLSINFPSVSQQCDSANVRHLASLEFLEILTFSSQYGQSNCRKTLLNFEVLGGLKKLNRIILRNILIGQFNSSEQLFSSLQYMYIQYSNLSESSAKMFKSMPNLWVIKYSNPSHQRKDIIYQQEIILKEYLKLPEGQPDELEVNLCSQMKKDAFEFLVQETSLGYVLRSIPFTKKDLKRKIKMTKSQTRLSADYLVKALVDQKPPLRVILIQHSPVSDRSVVSIVENFPELRCLSLIGCGITNKGAIAMCKLSRLQELNIRSNTISSFIIQKLLYNLQELYVFECIALARDHKKFVFLKNYPYFKNRANIQKIKS